MPRLIARNLTKRILNRTHKIVMGTCQEAMLSPGVYVGVRLRHDEVLALASCPQAPAGTEVQGHEMPRMRRSE